MHTFCDPYMNWYVFKKYSNFIIFVSYLKPFFKSRDNYKTWKYFDLIIEDVMPTFLFKYFSLKSKRKTREHTKL